MTEERDHLAYTAIWFVVATFALTVFGLDVWYAVSACVGGIFSLAISDLDNSLIYKKRLAAADRNDKRIVDCGERLTASFEANLARIVQLESAFEILRDVTSDLPGPVFSKITTLADAALKGKSRQPTQDHTT